VTRSRAQTTDPDARLLGLAEQVGRLLRARNQSIAVAESCTGGLLGAALTEVPGSSDYFLGGVIAYADRVKVEQLGVAQELLTREGAVSQAVAAAMALGIRMRLAADVGVSITGVAGPGAEGRKPAGLTFIGLANPNPRAVRFQWSGDRWENRHQSVLAALQLLAQELVPDR